MIFENSSIKPSLFFNNKRSFSCLEHGSIVRVEVVSRLASDTPAKNPVFAIKVQSTIFHVQSSQNFDIGQVFNARVILNKDVIELQALLPINTDSQSVFSQLQIPETPFTQYALHLYTQSTLQLDPQSILNLVRAY